MSFDGLQAYLSALEQRGELRPVGVEVEGVQQRVAVQGRDWPTRGDAKMTEGDERALALEVIEQALALARQADPEERAWEVGRVAVRLAMLDPERAFALVDEAEGNWRGDVTVAAVIAYPERATEFVQRTGDRTATRRAARGLALVDAARALVVARATEDDGQRAEALLYVAKAVAGEDPVQAATLAREAVTSARRSVPDPGTRDRAWICHLAAVTLCRVDPQAALELVRGISCDATRVRALLALAKELAPRDPACAAEALEEGLAAGREAEAREPASLLQDTIAATAQLDPLRAAALARTLTPPVRSVGALAELVPLLVDTPEAAWELGEEVVRLGGQLGWGTSGDYGGMWCRDALPPLARLDPERALRLAAQVEGRQYRESALKVVARVVASVDPALARRIAADLPRAEDRMSVLATAFEAGASVNPAEALALVQRIADDEERGYSLLYVWRGLIDSHPVCAWQLVPQLAPGFADGWGLRRLARALAPVDRQAAVAAARAAWQWFAHDHPSYVSLDPDWLESELTFLVRELAPIECGEALALARTYPPSAARARLLLEVADYLLRMPDWWSDDPEDLDNRVLRIGSPQQDLTSC